MSGQYCTNWDQKIDLARKFKCTMAARGFSVAGFSSKFLSILYFHLKKTCVKNVILALNLLNLYNIGDVSSTCWHLHHWAWAEPIVEEGLEFSVHTVPHHRRRNLLLWNKTYGTGRQGLGKVPLTVRAWTKRPNFILFFCLKLRILFFSQSDFSYKSVERRQFSLNLILVIFYFDWTVTLT